jgi:hypothetical protein
MRTQMLGGDAPPEGFAHFLTRSEDFHSVPEGDLTGEES